MKNEPLVTTATITALSVALLTLLVSFGIPLADNQVNAILGVVAVVAPFVVAAASRGKVTPNASVVEYAKQAEGREFVVAGEANDRLADGVVVRQVGQSDSRTVDLSASEVGADGVDDTPRRSADGGL